MVKIASDGHGLSLSLTIITMSCVDRATAQLNFPTVLGCEIVRKRFQVGADPLSGIKFVHRVLAPLFFFFLAM